MNLQNASVITVAVMSVCTVVSFWLGDMRFLFPGGLVLILFALCHGLDGPERLTRFYVRWIRPWIRDDEPLSFDVNMDLAEAHVV